MRREYNVSIAAYVPKGSREEDSAEVVREADATRPLFLKTTANKAVMWAVNSKMKLVVKKRAAQSQRGFVLARNFLDNIVEMDGYGRCYSAAPSASADLPMMLGYDFAQAFPSMQHAWLWDAVGAWEIPSGGLDLLKVNYLGVLVVSSDAERIPLYLVLRGVAQGCPASGSLFVMGVNPFVRDLERHLEQKDSAAAPVTRRRSQETPAGRRGPVTKAKA